MKRPKTTFTKALLAFLLASFLCLPTTGLLQTGFVQAAEDKLLLTISAQAPFEKVGDSISVSVKKVMNTSKNTALSVSPTSLDLILHKTNPSSAATDFTPRQLLTITGAIAEGDELSIELLNTRDNSKDVKFVQVPELLSGMSVFSTTIAAPFDLRKTSYQVFQDAVPEWHNDQIDTNREKQNAIKAMLWPYGQDFPTRGADNWKYFVRQDLWPEYQSMLNKLQDSIGNDSIEFDEYGDLADKLTGSDKGNWFTTMALGVLGFLSTFVANIINLEIKVIVRILNQADVVNNPVIADLWKSIRDLLNLTFLLIIFMMALSNILGFSKDNYGIKKNLPKLILMVIAVNFSRLFVGIILDFANVLEALMYSFGGMGPHGTGLSGVSCPNATFGLEDRSLPCRLMRIFQVAEVQNIGPALSSAETSGVAVGSVSLALAGLMMFFFLVGAMLGFLGIMLVLLARTIAIWFLTITSPIFFVGQSFEPLKKLADKWKESFFKYAFLPVKLAFYLSIGIRLIDAFSHAFSGGSYYYSALGDEDLLPTGTTAALGIYGQPVQLNQFMMMLFMFAMIWMGVFSSMKSDISAIDDLAGKSKGWAKSAMRGVGIPGVFTVRNAEEGLKNLWKYRKARIDASNATRAGKFAHTLAKPLEKTAAGLKYADKLFDNSLVKRIPGLRSYRLGTWLSDEVMGMPKGTSAILDRQELEHEMSEANKIKGKMGTAQVHMSLSSDLDAGRRGDVMHEIDMLGANQDDAQDMFGALMAMVAKHQIGFAEAIRMAQKHKMFHSGLLAVEDIAEQFKDEKTGEFNQHEFIHWLEHNGISKNDNASAQAKKLAALFKDGSFKMEDGTVRRVADMKLVKDNISKMALQESDGENWDNIIDGADDLKIDQAMSRDHQNKLIVKTNKYARGILGLKKILDLNMAKVAQEKLNYTAASLQEAQREAGRALDIILGNLTEDELKVVGSELEKDSTYINKSLSEYEKRTMSSQAQINLAKSRFQAVLTDARTNNKFGTRITKPDARRTLNLP